MEQLSASQEAIKLNPTTPHLNNHEIVLELAKHEARLDALEALLANKDEEK